MGTEALIEFDQVEAGYGNLTILHKASFQVREGLITLLCLLGAGLATSGCVLGGRRLLRRPSGH